MFSFCNLRMEPCERTIMMSVTVQGAEKWGRGGGDGKDYHIGKYIFFDSIRVVFEKLSKVHLTTLLFV